RGRCASHALNGTWPLEFSAVPQCLAKALRRIAQIAERHAFDLSAGKRSTGRWHVAGIGPAQELAVASFATSPYCQYGEPIVAEFPIQRDVECIGIAWICWLWDRRGRDRRGVDHTVDQPKRGRPRYPV